MNKYPWWRIAPFWICLLGVLTLSLLPGTQNLPSTGWDKSNHALAFAALYLLADLAYPRHIVRLFIALLAFGGLIEILQSMTGYRFAEWADLLAEAIGLGFGGVASWLRNRCCRSAANQSAATCSKSGQ